MAVCPGIGDLGTCALLVLSAEGDTLGCLSDALLEGLLRGTFNVPSGFFSGARRALLSFKIWFTASSVSKAGSDCVLAGVFGSLSRLGVSS